MSEDFVLRGPAGSVEPLLDPSASMNGSQCSINSDNGAHSLRASRDDERTPLLKVYSHDEEQRNDEKEPDALVNYELRSVTLLALFNWFCLAGWLVEFKWLIDFV